MPFEAGVAYFQAGDHRSALASFLLGSDTAPNYRGACLNAIHISSLLGTVTFVDSFLAAFVHSAPRDAADLQAFYKLGLLYEKAGYEDDARTVLGVVARHSPGYADVSKRLMRLEGAQDDLTELFVATQVLGQP